MKFLHMKIYYVIINNNCSVTKVQKIEQKEENSTVFRLTTRDQIIMHWQNMIDTQFLLQQR